MPRPSRRLLRLASLVVLLPLAVAMACYGLVEWKSRGKTFTSVSSLPDENRVAVVLGCAKILPDGRANLFFSSRIKAAVALYSAGKCRAIIVSGDNHVRGYDEPTDMKEALIAAGVPAGRVFCDYAGFRTLDSVLRAKEVFGQQRVVFVSQRFHNERAIYLASQFGMDAVGFNAADVRFGSAAKTYFREVLARGKAVLDTTLLRTQPKFLGPHVEISYNSN